MKEGQKFLVIEELDTEFRVSSIFLDKLSNLELLETKRVDNIKEIKKPYGQTPYVILALNSQHATTVEKEIEIKRPEPKQAIDEGEIDQLIFKALWNFLNEYRQFASKKMNIADLDTVLSEIEIKRVLLDSKTILSPVGFKGAKVRFRIRGTLVPRRSLEYMDSVKILGRDVKLVERLSIVSSFVGGGEFFVHVENENSKIFRMDSDELKYQKTTPWGINRIISPVSKFFSAEPATSVKIIRRYFEERLSSNLSKKLEKAMKPGFQSLLKTVKGVTKRRNVDIIINIPEPIYDASMKGYGKAKHLNLEKILETRGFNVIIKPSDNIPFFEKIYEPLILAGSGLFSSHYEDLNKMLRRRSGWLVPHP